jgi:hypothetical protein
MLGGEGRLGHVENHAKLVSAEESGAENDHVPSHFETGWLRCFVSSIIVAPAYRSPLTYRQHEIHNDNRQHVYYSKHAMNTYTKYKASPPQTLRMFNPIKLNASTKQCPTQLECPKRPNMNC